MSPFGGEKRFASAISVRLSRLGALSRGDRRAGGGGGADDLNAFGDLEGSKWASLAVRDTFDMLVTRVDPLASGEGAGGAAGPQRAELTESLHSRLCVGANGVRLGCTAAPPVARGGLGSENKHNGEGGFDGNGGIAAGGGDDGGDDNGDHDDSGDYDETDDNGGTVGGTGGPVGGDRGGSSFMVQQKVYKKLDTKRFLNRLLGCPVEVQEFLFQTFEKCTRSRISKARADGKYSDRALELKGSDVSEAGPREPIARGVELVKVRSQPTLTCSRGCVLAVYHGML